MSKCSTSSLKLRITFAAVLLLTIPPTQQARAETPTSPQPSGAKPAASPAEQIYKIEMELQDLFNSEAFWHQPQIALRYYDQKNIRMWDIMPPEEFRGPKALHDHYVDLVKMFRGGKIQFLDLETEGDGNVGYATMIQYFTALSEGKQIAMRLRVTDCFHKVQGRWVIAHEHISLPIELPVLTQMIVAK
jgi:ketosteroid isomerase-like protein